MLGYGQSTPPKQTTMHGVDLLADSYTVYVAISYTEYRTANSCGLDSLAESYRVPHLTATIPSHVQLTASELHTMADGYRVVHQSKQGGGGHPLTAGAYTELL